MEADDTQQRVKLRSLQAGLSYTGRVLDQMSYQDEDAPSTETLIINKYINIHK